MIDLLILISVPVLIIAVTVFLILRKRNSYGNSKFHQSVYDSLSSMTDSSDGGSNSDGHSGFGGGHSDGGGSHHSCSSGHSCSSHSCSSHSCGGHSCGGH